MKSHLTVIFSIIAIFTVAISSSSFSYQEAFASSDTMNFSLSSELCVEMVTVEDVMQITQYDDRLIASQVDSRSMYPETDTVSSCSFSIQSTDSSFGFMVFVTEMTSAENTQEFFDETIQQIKQQGEDSMTFADYEYNGWTSHIAEDKEGPKFGLERMLMSSKDQFIVLFNVLESKDRQFEITHPMLKQISSILQDALDDPEQLKELQDKVDLQVKQTEFTITNTDEQGGDCTSISGMWDNENKTCMIDFGLDIDSDSKLTVQKDVILYIADNGMISNMGEMTNRGTIQIKNNVSPIGISNENIVINHGIINNSNWFENQGVFENHNEIHTYNSRVLTGIDDINSQILNHGSLINHGMIDFDERSFLANDGDLENHGIMISEGDMQIESIFSNFGVMISNGGSFSYDAEIKNDGKDANFVNNGEMSLIESSLENTNGAKIVNNNELKIHQTLVTIQDINEIRNDDIVHTQPHYSMINSENATLFLDTITISDNSEANLIVLNCGSQGNIEQRENLSDAITIIQKEEVSGNDKHMITICDADYNLKDKDLTIKESMKDDKTERDADADKPQSNEFTQQDNEIKSPMYQFKKAGVPLEEIQCRQGLELFANIHNEKPMCLSSDTAEKLLEREAIKPIIDQ